MENNFSASKGTLAAENVSAKEVLNITEKIREFHKNWGVTPLAHCVCYGCQQNEADMERIKGLLKASGYGFTDNPENAQLIIVNTCAVREGAEMRVLGNVGAYKKLKEKNENLVLCICGCMMQEKHMAEKIKKSFHFVDVVFGTHNIQNFPFLLYKKLTGQKRIFEIFDGSDFITEGLPVCRENTFSAKVSIMYGCNNFCSYCIVPYTRGRERSRSMEKIVEEIKNLAKGGCKEVMLLGQNVNSYQNPDVLGGGFATLLREIDKIKGIERVRFMSSHPKDFSDDTIDAIANCKSVCKHIHLALQSGSSDILKKMNRKYTKESFLALIDKIKAKIPGVALTTDIIVGFPGETEDDFAETLDVLDKVRFDGIFSFIFSPRKGTPAAEMEDVATDEEKQGRFERLLALQNEITHEKTGEYVGKTCKVLVEGASKEDENMLTGHTDTFKLVHFKGDKTLVGKIIEVKIISAKTFYMLGEIERKN